MTKQSSDDAGEKHFYIQRWRHSRISSFIIASPSFPKAPCLCFLHNCLEGCLIKKITFRDRKKIRKKNKKKKEHVSLSYLYSVTRTRKRKEKKCSRGWFLKKCPVEYLRQYRESVRGGRTRTRDHSVSEKLFLFCFFFCQKHKEFHPVFWRIALARPWTRKSRASRSLFWRRCAPSVCRVSVWFHCTRATSRTSVNQVDVPSYGFLCTVTATLSCSWHTVRLVKKSMFITTSRLRLNRYCTVERCGFLQLESRWYL